MSATSAGVGVNLDMSNKLELTIEHALTRGGREGVEEEEDEEEEDEEEKLTFIGVYSLGFGPSSVGNAV